MNDRFNTDYSFGAKMKTFFIPHIREYFSKFGSILEIKDTENQRYFDQNVGADLLIRFQNKYGVIKDIRIDCKCRRNKYLSYFKGDILFEIRDNERSGWLDKTGTWIAYGFSNEQENGLAFSPIFFKITDKKVDWIKQQVRTKILEVKKSYDNTEFVLINHHEVKRFESADNEDLLMGEKQVSLNVF